MKLSQGQMDQLNAVDDVNLPPSGMRRIYDGNVGGKLLLLLDYTDPPSDVANLRKLY